MADQSANHADMVIVGAGFAGLYMMYKARQLGLSARGFDRASNVGGTWWWNRYPGARCDVESLQYSYSWDPELQQEWEWTERFATQSEILAYANHVATRHDLRHDFTFETGVTAAAYDSDARSWDVTLDSGETIKSHYVILATGCLSEARIPEIPGRGNFAGKTYHTGNWPRREVDFTGERVGVIGTGSSGIQVIPEIAKQAARLTVFQRTANFSIPARNQPLDDKLTKWWKAHYDALRHEAREETRTGILYDPATKRALDVDADTREREYRWRWEKGGTNFTQAFTDLLTDEEANATASDFVKARIRDAVHDPDTAEALCPEGYPIFTKRVCLDSQYFETYNRPNVHLVDLRKTPLKRMTADGIETGGAFHALDAIVFATGFDAITGAITSIDIRGCRGQTIKEKWADGPRAYLGMASADFPNMFMITGPGSPSVLSNVILSIEQHVEWISEMIGAMEAVGAREVEATQEAEDSWVGHVNEVASQTLMPRAASWYMGANIPGKPRVFMPFIGVAAYRKICDDIAADGYRGFRFDGAERLPEAGQDKTS